MLFCCEIMNKEVEGVCRRTSIMSGLKAATVIITHSSTDSYLLMMRWVQSQWLQHSVNFWLMSELTEEMFPVETALLMSQEKRLVPVHIIYETFFYFRLTMYKIDCLQNQQSFECSLATPAIAIALLIDTIATNVFCMWRPLSDRNCGSSKWSLQLSLIIFYQKLFGQCFSQIIYYRFEELVNIIETPIARIKLFVDFFIIGLNLWIHINKLIVCKFC